MYHFNLFTVPMFLTDAFRVAIERRLVTTPGLKISAIEVSHARPRGALAFPTEYADLFFISNQPFRSLAQAICIDSVVSGELSFIGKVFYYTGEANPREMPQISSGTQVTFDRYRKSNRTINFAEYVDFSDDEILLVNYYYSRFFEDFVFPSGAIDQGSATTLNPIEAAIQERDALNLRLLKTRITYALAVLEKISKEPVAELGYGCISYEANTGAQTTMKSLKSILDGLSSSPMTVPYADGLVMIGSIEIQNRINATDYIHTGKLLD